MTAVKFKKYIANPILVLLITLTSIIGIIGSGGSVSTNASPVYRVENTDAVCLMVNVYWGDQYLPKMLDIFAKNDIKTTFFVGGCWAEKNEEMLKSIYAQGHEIANHGYFHKDHKKIDEARNREEITSTHNLIKSILGIEMNLFSPPSASFSDKTLQIAGELGYTTVMYSKDTIDWRDKDEQIVYSRATKNVTGGDLILMHPTAATVAVLQQIIDKIISQGLRLTTVSGVISSTGEA